MWPFLSPWEQIKGKLTVVGVDDNHESCIK